MAVANCSTHEEIINKIRGCLLKEIEAIGSLVTNLVKVSSNPSGEMDTQKIKELVFAAYGEAQQAYNVASGYVKKIQSECEKLTEQKGGLQEEMKDKKNQLGSLQRDLNTIKKEKEMYENRLQVAESSLQLAKDALEKQKEHEKSMLIGTIVGASLIFIPFVGIAGAATAITCGIALAEAQKNQENALEEVRSRQADVSRCSSNLRACTSSIEKKRNEINQIEKKLQDVENELKRLHELLEEFFETDSKLKHAATILNELVGKVNVLKFRSEKFLNLESLITVLDDIVLHIVQLPDRQGGKILCLGTNVVEMLKSIRSDMKAIAFSDSDLSEWY